MNEQNEQAVQGFHACDLCGTERVPGNGTCGTCGTEYRPWTYLSHEQASRLLITATLRDYEAVYGLEYIATNYAEDRAVVAVFDMFDGKGHIGDL